MKVVQLKSGGTVESRNRRAAERTLVSLVATDGDGTVSAGDVIE